MKLTTRRVTVFGLACLLGVSTTAWAQGTPQKSQGNQTPVTSTTTAPTINEWYYGGAIGVGIVDSASFVANGEAGYRVWKTLDALIEGGYTGNLATAANKNKANNIAAALQASQGQPATASLTVPTGHLMFGTRWVFESRGRYRPYLLVAIGGASVHNHSKFTLGGADVTDQLPSFGITLGSDLSGSYRPFAVEFGGGVLMPYHKKWFFDGSIRIMNVDTVNQHTNSTRILFGGGRRF
jgi:hypothetical protein